MPGIHGPHPWRSRCARRRASGCGCCTTSGRRASSRSGWRGRRGGPWCCWRPPGRRSWSSRRPWSRRRSRACPWWCSRPTGRRSCEIAVRRRRSTRRISTGEPRSGSRSCRCSTGPRRPWRTGAGSRVVQWPWRRRVRRVRSRSTSRSGSHCCRTGRSWRAIPCPPRPFASVVAGRRTLRDDALDELAARLAGARRGLILAGPDDDPALPTALAELRPGHRLPDPRRSALGAAHRTP